MAASSSTTDGTLSLNTVLHMITIKLSPSNYLLWKSQMLPLLSFQNLLSHVDGTTVVPAREISADKQTIPNPLYTQWLAQDQKVIIILNASLSEEAMGEILGLETARQIWVTLEPTYNNTSIERVHNLRDQLRHTSKGTASVAEFSRKFKSICDQLSAVGQPIDETDKLHWLLCGLGASFETFSTAIRATKPPPAFRDILIQAESHELFIRSIHGTQTASWAFQSWELLRWSWSGTSCTSLSIVCKEGHYANLCPNLSSFASQSAPSKSELAKAFHAQCHVTTSGPDWVVDSGATDHMTPHSNNVHTTTSYPGDTNVTFGNGPKHETSHRARSV